MHMDYKVTMTQFVISDISINADPAQLTDIQTPINISTEFSFTCRPPVNPDDATVMVECKLEIHSAADTLTVNLSASGIFQFDSVPDNWIEPVKELCTPLMVEACMTRVQNILKEMGMALALNKQ